MPTFSESDAREVFARAAKLQQATDGDDPTASGLSIEELQEIGRAAGLDPAHIAAAAASLGGTLPAVAAPTTRFGVPTEIRRTRRLPGPLSDAAWERIVAHLRTEFKTPGTAGQVGRIREWNGSPTSGHGGAGVHVAARPTPDGATEIAIERPGVNQVTTALVQGAGAFAVMALFFAVTILLRASEPAAWTLPALFAAFALVMGGGGIIGTRAWARRLDTRFDAVLDRIELLARDDARTDAPAERATVAPTSTSAIPSTGPTPAARIDLDALGDLAPAPTRRTRRRTR